MDPFKNHKQYFLAEVQAGAALLGLLSGNRARREANERALRESEQALERQRAARARVEEQKARYAQYQFQNPFEGMENPFEDLKVSTEAADFQLQQAAQQRANIMAGLRGAAGASGIAGLAQTLANQGVIQARQVSADIARQGVAGMQMGQRNLLALASLSGVDGPLSNLFGGGGQQRVNVGVPLGLPSDPGDVTAGLMDSLGYGTALTQQIPTPSYYNYTDENLNYNRYITGQN
jgi:hypothetical protein